MKGLSSVQIEQLKHIGDYLQQVRETQAITLEKVAKDTFIPLRHLEALEVGEAARLPEPVYIKGFIRRYADVLGLDGQEIADTFELDPPPTAATPPAPAPDSTPTIVSSPSEKPQPEPSRQRSSPVLVYVLSGVTVAGVLGAIAFGVTNFILSRSQVSTASNSAATGSTLSNPNTSVPPTASENTNPGSTPGRSTTQSSPSGLAIPATTAPVQVNVSLTDRSWMEVVADGKVEFTGIMTKGEERTWTAKNNLSIRAGNAGAVVASHNQGQAKPLGRMGDVVDVSFSRNREVPQNEGTLR